MVELDGKYYYLDLDEVVKFLTEKPDKQYIETQEYYDENGKLTNRTVFTKDINDTMINIKYDVLKSMLEALYNGGIETDEGNMKYLQEMDDMSIGLKLVFNSLIEKELIKNKLD